MPRRGCLEHKQANRRSGGRLIAYGFSVSTTGGRRNLVQAGFNLLRMPRFDPLSLLNSSKAVIGYHVVKLKSRRPDWYREDLATAMNLLAAGEIAPVIGACVPLTEVAHAHELLNDASVSGKVVLMMDCE